VPDRAVCAVAGCAESPTRLDLNNHTRACRQVKELLKQERNVDELLEVLVQTAGGLLAAVTLPIDVPFRSLGPLGRYLSRSLLNHLLDWPRGRRIVLGSFHDWYGSRERGLTNDAIAVLVDLNRWGLNLTDEDNHQRSEELLWDAFLTDLREDFRRNRHADELAFNCAALLDNVDTELGQRFLHGLVKARRQRAAGDRGVPDPMTVLATSRGAALADLPAAGTAELSSGTRGSAAPGGSKNGIWRQWSVGDDKDPLVVTGLGVSVTQTELGAKDLTAHRIPMVGAITMADELSYANIPGFVRVSPTDQEGVQSLLAYLRAHPQLDSAILVYDSNSDDPANPDLFTKSLRNDLSSGMSNLIKSTPPLSFVGASGQSEASPDLFSNITTNVCAVAPKVVLYAGRWLDLLSFLTSLENRVCPDTPMTVVTVNTNLGTLTNEEEALRNKKITVVNAVASDPLGWPNNVPGTPKHFADFQSEFSALGFDPADLDNGDAIATHDAVFVAVKATRLAVPPTPSARNGVPKAVDVLSQLLNLNNLNAVPGAGGELSFSFRGTRGDDSGHPCGKPIPVLEIPPSGSSAGEVGPPYITC
jgi:hypothetical protein